MPHNIVVSKGALDLVKLVLKHDLALNWVEEELLEPHLLLVILNRNCVLFQQIHSDSQPANADFILVLLQVLQVVYVEAIIGEVVLDELIVLSGT